MKNYSFSNLTVRTFPTIADLNNPWIFGGVRVIINVSDWIYPEQILKAIEEKGIHWYHFPLVEEDSGVGSGVSRGDEAYTNGITGYLYIKESGELPGSLMQVSRMGLGLRPCI